MIDERVEKVTGVVHLAAIPAPGQAPNHVTFEVNTVSTYNIFEAARQLGIRNVVWASSETVYGIPYPKGPAYVPVDEEIEHPETAYSLSKLMGEKMAEQFCRWDPKTEDRRPALLQRHGAARLRALPRLRQGPARRATSTCGPISTPATRRRRSAWRSRPSSRAPHVFGIANADSVMSRANDDAPRQGLSRRPSASARSSRTSR